MEVILRKVGNSLVVTIPQTMVDSMNIKKGDVLNLECDKQEIIITPKKKRLKGELYLESLYGKPFEEIEPWEYEVVSTGEPVGEEEW